MRKPHLEGELRDKEERRRLKEQRDYEIFDQMPYKYNTKTFSMKERHPISKMRFQSATNFIKDQKESTSDEMFRHVKSLWEAKQTKMMWIVPDF